MNMRTKRFTTTKMPRAGWRLLLAAAFTATAAGQLPPRPELPPLPEGPGKEIVETVCTGCHDLLRVMEARHPEAVWEAVIDQMQAEGADLSPQEYNVVLDYLIANFNPETPPLHN